MVSKKQLLAELLVKLWLIPSSVVAVCCWAVWLINR